MMCCLINDCAPAHTSKWIVKVLHNPIARHSQAQPHCSSQYAFNTLTALWLGFD